MVYRTKTYLAGDWDGDKDAVDQIHKWNNSEYYSKLDFVDVHDYVQARDSSLLCTIKDSLHERMNMSKTFILIVGEHTRRLTKGDCRFCPHYHNYYWETCDSNRSITHKSYVDYECEQAVKYGLNIVVLYNSIRVDKLLCPDVLRDKGVHVPMKKVVGKYSVEWDYQTVRDAINRY